MHKRKIYGLGAVLSSLRQGTQKRGREKVMRQFALKSTRPQITENRSGLFSHHDASEVRSSNYQHVTGVHFWRENASLSPSVARRWA